ncbi:TPA: hypothetical protein BOS_4038 [Bos taurus]|nr:TPA: hypothetical protein BOS_4038 [Bos taurus]
MESQQPGRKAVKSCSRELVELPLLESWKWSLKMVKFQRVQPEDHGSRWHCTRVHFEGGDPEGQDAYSQGAVRRRRGWRRGWRRPGQPSLNVDALADERGQRLGHFEARQLCLDVVAEALVVLVDQGGLVPIQVLRDHLESIRVVDH